MILYKLIGIAGMLLITYGVFNKRRGNQDLMFAIGGLCLLIYSIYLRDFIFIILQITFTSASLYEMYKIKNKKK